MEEKPFCKQILCAYLDQLHTESQSKGKSQVLDGPLDF